MEALVRFSIFLGVFAVMAMWEVWYPRRALVYTKAQRWLTNLALTALDTVVVRVTMGAAAVSVALFAQQHGWGVLPLLHLPYWGTIVLSLVVLDFAIYLQHVGFHAVPLLWRLHIVHHVDLDVDVTTGLRFHPLEILLSMLYKAVLVLFLGASPAAVLLFEVLLNAASQFNHSNVRLPAIVERVLRQMVITPDLHRIHHSVVAAETQANFGFSVPFWDHLCGTYRDQPSHSHATMTLGVPAYRDPRRLGLGRLLLLPFILRQGRRSDEEAADAERHGLETPRVVSPRSQQCRIPLRVLLMLGLGGGMAVAWLLVRDRLTVAHIEPWVRQLGWWAPALYLALWLVIPPLCLPGTPLGLAAGTLFGPLWGSVYTLVGATAGATLAFGIARYLAGAWVAQRVSGGLQRILQGVEAQGWHFVVFVRLVPLFPFNLLNYALGLTPIRLRVYVVASCLGMVPGTVAYVYLGYAGREALTGDANLIRKGMLALGFLVAVVLIPAMLKRWQRWPRLTKAVHLCPCRSEEIRTDA